MQWLAALCVKRPVFATVLILSLTVIGAFSFTRLGVDRFPKVDFPTVLVTTVQPGAAPEQIETEITDKIEAAGSVKSTSGSMPTGFAPTTSRSTTSRARCRRRTSKFRVAA